MTVYSTRIVSTIVEVTTAESWPQITYVVISVGSAVDDPDSSSLDNGSPANVSFALHLDVRDLGYRADEAHCAVAYDAPGRSIAACAEVVLVVVSSSLNRTIINAWVDVDGTGVTTIFDDVTQ